MAKRKVGLHKEITAIFDGVPIPKGDSAQQTSNAPASNSHSSPRKLTPAPQAPSTPKPKPLLPAQSPSPPLPKAAPAKQSETDAAIKTSRPFPGQQLWQQLCQQIRHQIQNKLFAPKPGVDAIKQKVMVILVPVLFIVLIVVFTQVLGTPSRKSIKPTNPVPAGAGAGSNNRIDWQIPEPYPVTLRDPMQIGSTPTAQVETGELIVIGIVYSDDNPSAVIGTEIVYEGDKILKATVIKINKDNVEFEMNGKKWTQKVVY